MKQSIMIHDLGRINSKIKSRIINCSKTLPIFTNMLLIYAEFVQKVHDTQDYLCWIHTKDIVQLEEEVDKLCLLMEIH